MSLVIKYLNSEKSNKHNCSAYLIITGQQPILHIFPETAKCGTSVTLNCMVTINAAIAFKLNTDFEASCGPPLGGEPGVCHPTEVLQNISESLTSWTKSSVDVSDDGIWTCEVGGKSSDNKTLLIYGEL